MRGLLAARASWAAADAAGRAAAGKGDGLQAGPARAGVGAGAIRARRPGGHQDRPAGLKAAPRRALSPRIADEDEARSWEAAGRRDLGRPRRRPRGRRVRRRAQPARAGRRGQALLLNRRGVRRRPGRCALVISYCKQRI